VTLAGAGWIVVLLATQVEPPAEPPAGAVVEPADAPSSIAVSAELSATSSAPAADGVPPLPTAGGTAEVWTLEQCLRRAMELRAELRGDDAAVAEASAEVEYARAGYLPSASVSAGYRRAAGAMTGLAGINDFALGVTARWVATELAWVPGEVRSAEAYAAAVAAGTEITLRAIRLEVLVAYDVLWGARRVAELTRETLAAAEHHREYAVVRGEVGLGAQADVARAEVEIADAVLAIAAADAAVETARARLARAIGLPAGATVDIPDDEPEAGPVPEPFAEVPERPELAVLERQVEAVREQAGSLEAGYWPQVTISASYGVEDDDFFPTQQVWAVGATVDVPLLSWAATSPAVDAAEARAAQLEARIETTRNDLVLEVQAAWYALQEALARLEACGPLLASAAENLRVAEGLYQEGAGSMIELVDARSAVQRAQITRVLAVRDVAIAAAEYRYAAGEEP
jgi:outer membrane protein